jgi:hypothetical protein
MALRRGFSGHKTGSQARSYAGAAATVSQEERQRSASYTSDVNTRVRPVHEAFCWLSFLNLFVKRIPIVC